LRLPSGRDVDLSTVLGERENPFISDAVQTPDGWLLNATGAAQTSALWMVRSDGSLHKLIDGSYAPVAVAPDGRRFAWRDGDTVRTGHLDGDAVVGDRSTPVPGRWFPIGYTGEAVVLGYTETGGGIDHHDVWVPLRGDYVPTPQGRTANVAVVYGPAPDGHS